MTVTPGMRATAAKRVIEHAPKTGSFQWSDVSFCKGRKTMRVATMTPQDFAGFLKTPHETKLVIGDFHKQVDKKQLSDVLSQHGFKLTSSGGSNYEITWGKLKLAGNESHAANWADFLHQLYFAESRRLAKG